MKRTILNIESDNICRIFLSNGDTFEVDTYEGIKITPNNETLNNLDKPDYYSFWAESINGKKQSPEVQIAGSVDKIAAVETMELLERDQ